MPGIVEFAKLAGVSVATVSRAFTGHGRISAKTSDRILRLAAKHGFTPNIHASRLSSRESKAIGLFVIVGRESPRQGEIRELVLDISSAIVESGYSATLMISSNAKDRIFQRVVTSGAVDGVLFAATESQPPATIRRIVEHLPCVLLAAGKQTAAPGFGMVSVASRDGVAAAVGRLTQLGHRRIAFIDDGQDEDKLVGYKKGLYVAGIPFENDMVERTTGRYEEGVMAIRRLLARRTFSATVTASDRLALGVMAALQESGRKIPGAMSVVGFGDTEPACLATPPLSSLHVNRREMGLLAMTILAEMIREARKRGKVVSNESHPRWCRLIQPILMERGSTGPNQRMSTQYYRAE